MDDNVTPLPSTSTTDDKDGDIAGVFISAKNLGDGKYAVNFQLLGDQDILAVPTLLELAVLAIRAQLGLPNPQNG